VAHRGLEFVHLDEGDDQEDKRRQKQQHPETNKDVIH
jgi:hypothetical protein